MVNVQKAKPRSYVSEVWKKAAIYFYFILFCLIILLPIYWLVRSSLTVASDLNKVPPVYFPVPSPINFKTLIEQVPFFEYVRNSLIFALATTFVTMVVSYMAAYAFARIQFPGSGFLLWVLVLSMALPDVGTIVPLYRLLASLNLLDTIAGLTLVLGFWLQVKQRKDLSNSKVNINFAKMG